MGMGLFKGSSSSYDDKRSAGVTIIREVVEKPVVVNVNCRECPYSRLPNPDPWNWYLVRAHHMVATSACNNWVLIEVVYPDCKNYEGRKIMLYKNCTAHDLEKQKHLDPHFSSNKKFHTPFARFEPTEAGWAAGIEMLRHLE